MKTTIKVFCENRKGIQCKAVTPRNKKADDEAVDNSKGYNIIFVRQVCKSLTRFLVFTTVTTDPFSIIKVIA